MLSLLTTWYYKVLHYIKIDCLSLDEFFEFA